MAVEREIRTGTEAQRLAENPACVRIVTKWYGDGEAWDCYYVLDRAKYDPAEHPMPGQSAYYGGAGARYANPVVRTHESSRYVVFAQSGGWDI